MTDFKAPGTFVHEPKTPKIVRLSEKGATITATFRGFKTLKTANGTWTLALLGDQEVSAPKSLQDEIYRMGIAIGEKVQITLAQIKPAKAGHFYVWEIIRRA